MHQQSQFVRTEGTTLFSEGGHHRIFSEQCTASMIFFKVPMHCEQQLLILAEHFYTSFAAKKTSRTIHHQ